MGTDMPRGKRKTQVADGGKDLNYDEPRITGEPSHQVEYIDHFGRIDLIEAATIQEQIAMMNEAENIDRS